MENDKRHIVSISAVPAGQCRSTLENDSIQGIGNAAGVFALMSDGTVELFTTNKSEWTKLPEIPERD